MSRPNTDLPLSIRVSSIDAHFDCPVCMCYFTKACLTSCGHRFCENCIKGCIDTRHKCPCCNTRLEHAQLTHDPQFDSLVASVLKERKAAEQSYFSDLIKAAHEQENREHAREKTPIEIVLQKHLSRSLAQHEVFYQEIESRLKQHIATVEMDKETRLQMLREPGTLSEEEVAVRIVEINEECDALQQVLQTELTNSTQLIVDAYDRFLTTSLPEPSVLPVTVPIRFLGKELKLRNQVLQPMTKVADIKTEVIKELARRCDNVLSFPDEVKFLLLRPFTKNNAEITDDLLIAIANQTSAHRDVIVMSFECCPVLEVDAQPGSEIVIVGPVVLSSDVPKKCYAKTYNKAQPEMTNYYTCDQCKFSWICEVCRETCHKNHTTKPKIINYTPTWACCYCLKKSTIKGRINFNLLEEYI
ncbi:E3 ubiquitin-protein ligase TRIM69-like isoform X2 [Anneissia japonica]|uniref:E3 ubiquitin-protein ligase TRIM69-like isoform X2 n=1 Tax=Anneissia japonica TaxID=1529436 RepID=UPI001425983F|nr:E3 ubiquitin-protein ligase TRIM69-like isoform X2 [Anneissia japonica]